MASDHNLRTQFPFPPRIKPANAVWLFLGPGRCYPFWQEVLGCYVVNSGDGASGKKKCVPALDDYYECLHHRKEVRTIPVRSRYLYTRMMDLGLIMGNRNNRLSAL
jgi:hypothetical protein